MGQHAHPEVRVLSYRNEKLASSSGKKRRKVLKSLNRAWVFAAGLVLGFSLLVDTGTKCNSRGAFHSAKQVLQHLGCFSPQAAQYHHILTSFSDAIDVYNDKLEQERHVSKPRFVERILSLDHIDCNVEARDTFKFPPNNCTPGMESGATASSAMAYISDPLIP